MKINRSLTFALVNYCTFTALQAQTPLVGTGSIYNDIFPASTPVTYDVPGGGLLSITLSNGSTNGTRGLWNLTAQGGANASLLGLGLLESAAETQLTGSALKFDISNDNNSLLGLLGVGASVHYAWNAQAYFNTSGSELSYTPNTHYSISFDIDGNNGLLSSTLGLTPTFNFALIDGNGNALASNSSGTLINLVGLLGTGVTSGTVHLDYTVAGTVPTGNIGVRFTGDALVGATAVSLGTDYATISNLNITATPVPEPGGALLIASVGVVALLRRRRMGNA